MSNIEEQIKQEPVQAIMTLIMRLCNDEQRRVIYDKLGRRVSLDESPDMPTEQDLVAEAELRYPCTSHETGMWKDSDLSKLEQQAYIECRRKNIARIRELEAENEGLKKYIEHLENSVEGLKGQQQDMRDEFRDYQQQS